MSCLSLKVSLKVMTAKLMSTAPTSHPSFQIKKIQKGEQVGYLQEDLGHCKRFMANSSLMASDFPLRVVCCKATSQGPVCGVLVPSTLGSVWILYVLVLWLEVKELQPRSLELQL